MNAHVGVFAPGGAPTSSRLAAELPPRLLFVGVAGEPGADRIVADMARLGAICAVVAPAESFAARSRFAQRVFALPDWRWRPLRAQTLAFRIEQIVDAWRPDLIMPIDDLSSMALRDANFFARSSDRLRGLLATSLGDPRNFDVASSRRSMRQLARAIGVRTPREADAGSLKEARAVASAYGYPVALKRDLLGGGVAIVGQEKRMASAYRALWAHAQSARIAGWVPGYRNADASLLSVQETIPGELAYRVAACVNGREIESMDFAIVKRGPYDTRPGAFIKPIEHDEMTRASRRMIAAMNVSGLVALDFVLSPRGEAYLLDMIPRPVPSGHLGALYGRDVHAAALRGRAVTYPGRGETFPSRAPGISPEIIALFPQAIDNRPDDPDLKPGSDVYHDVPWDDRLVLDAYRLWLEQRHPGIKPAFADRRGGACGSRSVNFRRSS